jgi:acetoacetyl-CoA synthetase
VNTISSETIVTQSLNVPLWQPSEGVRQQANLTHYMEWLKQKKGLDFDGPLSLWEWSVNNLTDFWASLWDYFQIKASEPYQAVLAERKMPGAKWFSGAKLNYAEHIFREASEERPALIYASEERSPQIMSWSELHQKTTAVAAALKELGVKPGDRVVAYLPNIPETIIAFLATASLGAIWSCCGPDLGTNSVIDRFKQIAPKVLFAVDGYRYNGKAHDRRAVVSQLQTELTSLEHLVLVPHLYPESVAEEVAVNPVIVRKILTPGQTDSTSLPGVYTWSQLIQKGQETGRKLHFEQVSFDHPLWILYSSGTTGLPKAIVQGHGGILLEHLKSLHLSSNLTPESVFFWFTTTSWMMWNMSVSALLTGATVFLYNGNPGYPDLSLLWRYVEEFRINFFGTSPAFIAGCMKGGLEPNKLFDLSSLHTVGITASPLPPEGFHWIYDKVKKDVWVASSSGGTDVCTGFVGGCILLPVYAGELSGKSLGVKVEAFDEDGNSVVDQVGELVVTEPMPSMPLYFWNDPDGERYRASYFDMYPGVWRHGDWIKLNSRGGAIIYGRSDSTINRRGVRMGSSEIYRVVEALPQVRDSLVVGVELADGAGYYMPLFVVLSDGAVLDEELKATINQRLRASVSPNHVPDEIIAVSYIPYTLTGKKLEVPVKKLLMGLPVEKVISRDAMQNPEALQFYLDFAVDWKVRHAKSS